MVANLFIMRRALDVRVRELSTCSRVACLSDAETQLERASLDNGEVAYYTHLDDVLTMAGTQEVASALADIFQEALEDVGFVVKRRAIEGDEKYIGYCRTVSPARWQPSPRRIGDLDRALELVEYHAQPPVQLVEVVVAIFVWIRLLRREALSSLHALFSWIEVARRRRTVFWNSCRREITFMWVSLHFHLCGCWQAAMSLGVRTRRSGRGSDHP